MAIDWAAVWGGVQAVGSVAAIGVAIWIGRESDRRSRELVEGERMRQATIAASMVSMRLDQLASEAQSKAGFLRQLLQTVQGDSVEVKNEETIHNIFLLTPEHLRSEFRGWALLFDRDNGIRAGIAIDYVETYNHTIGHSVDFFLATGRSAREFSRLLADAAQRLDDVQSALRETSDALEEAHGLSAEE